ncbi:MAG TPA: hypothetical protein VFJ90_05700, partial [Candidatus Didemnitutus sp.]|nr:hypothetical protein [Candidatus Didemnitutus sp.]
MQSIKVGGTQRLWRNGETGSRLRFRLREFSFRQKNKRQVVRATDTIGMRRPEYALTGREDFPGQSLRFFQSSQSGS